MNTTINYSLINFGQKVPTALLLECGLEKTNYDHYKQLCLSIGNQFPGHVGYTGKALKYIQTIKKKNPEINEFIEQLKDKDINIQREKINQFVAKHGNTIDVEI